MYYIYSVFFFFWLVGWVFLNQASMHQIRSDQSLSRVRLFATPWIAARQASLSITNSRSSLRLVGYCTTYHGVCQNVNAVFFSSKSQGLDCPSLHVYYCCSRRSYWNELVSACSVAQSYPIVCDPMDCSPPSSFVHDILQARILESVATSSSRGCSRPRDRICVSCISCIAGKFFTIEPLGKPQHLLLVRLK